MDPSRVLEPTTFESNQDHKRRCFENLVVRRAPKNIENGVKCAFEVEVIDDTALIDVSVFKKKKYDMGFANNARTKQENDGKVKKNKGFKKMSAKSLAKNVNEKKVVGDRVASEKKVSEVKEVKGFKGYRKTSGKVKAVYVRKDAKVANVVEEQKKVSDNGLIVNEKMVSETVQETDVNLIVSEDKEESALGLVETDVSLNVAKGEDQEESTVELVESESVDENDDVLKLNLEMDVNVGKIEVEEDRDVCENENVIVGSKKVVYSREELEALRFVDEDGQTSKWIEVYCAFTPLVAREYAGLVVDACRQTQRYSRAGSCGLNRYANDTAILGVPPVLPMCSVSSYRKIAPYDRVGFRANFI
ncbi:hypothetical protein Tco_0699496 [Tanacetum coccineum]